MVKKLTHEEFCTVAHRQAYHDEQEQLAVARLLEDQQRRKPARKPLGRQKSQPASPTAPAVADHLQGQFVPRTITNKPWLAPLGLTFAPETTHPQSCATISVPRAGLAEANPSLELVSPFGQASVEQAMAALSLVQQPPSLIAPAFPAKPAQQQPAQQQSDLSPLTVQGAVSLAFAPAPPLDPDLSPRPEESAAQPLLPHTDLEVRQQLLWETIDLTKVAGSQLPFDLARCFEPVAPNDGASLDAAPATEFNPFSLPAPLPLASVAALPPIAAALSVEEGLSVESPDSTLRAPLLLPFLTASAKPQLLSPEAALPASLTIQQSTDRVASDTAPVPTVAPAPDLPASFSHYQAALAPSIAGPSNADFNEPTIVCFANAIQRLFSRPSARAPRPAQLTAADRLTPKVLKALGPASSPGAAAILARPSNKCEPFTEQHLYPDGFLKSVEGRWAASSSLFAFNEPIPPKARIASVRRSSLGVLAKTFRTSRQTGITVHPDRGLVQPIMREWQRPEKSTYLKPALHLRIVPAKVSSSPFAALSPFSQAGYKLSWEAVQQRWHDAPNDLRWIAIAVPLVIGLLWFANTPSAQTGAKGRITSMVPNVGGLLNTSFNNESLDNLKQNIQRRAAVELSDDFRQGLGDWAGAGDWSKGWTYDPAGFIRPRQLALYTPSLGLEDYRFEFLGAIERKALSWVFRAADVKNYYAARLEITRGGPLPTVELVRYAVINGRVSARKSIPLPMQARLDTIYRVRVDVRGSDYVTTVQGQVVDVFSDDRLLRGGVGFFSEPGEDARLRWLEVAHQYDMLGRLCAYLVPYNVSNSNVRSAP
jgi:hypothetical protein